MRIPMFHERDRKETRFCPQADPCKSYMAYRAWDYEDCCGKMAQLRKGEDWRDAPSSSLQQVLVEFVVHGLQADSQDLGCLCLVVAGLLECFENDLLFDFVQRLAELHTVA